MLEEKLPLKNKKEVIKVFTQIKFNTSSETEVSPKHGYFSNPERFWNQPASLFSLNFRADDEFSSVRNDILHADYAPYDHLSSYTATLLRQ